VHLSIAPASRVAVLARGGKGKSTLLELVGGLRGCTSGVLELNGLDYRDCSLAGVRDHVVLVRDIEIFPGTLLENVRLGSGASVSEVRESLVHAGLGDVLLSLPEGLNTKLTTGGQPLSHSQALRVMLARAFVRRPGVLLLDEVIDHLEDFDPNGSLAATLFGPERPWTLIVTTEDKEVASHFERVFSISEGRLVDGLPEELHAVSVQEGRE
jgi:putative ABC transport system ATP-binding protein